MTRRLVLAALVCAPLALAVASSSGAVTATPHAAATPHVRKFFGGIVSDLPTGATRPGDRHPSDLPGRSPSARSANLPYGGGPVLHSNRTHVIFWQPSGSGLTFDPGYVALISRFMSDVAADSRKPTNIYGLSGQYADANGPATYNSTYAGAVVATDPLPPSHCVEPLPPPLGGGPGWTSCLDDGQMVNEIEAVIHADRLPTTSTDIYFLVLPQGLGSCEFSGPDDCALGGSTAGSYCGYHSATGNGLAYAVIPYNAVPGHCQSGNPRPNASTADPALSTVSHEHNEMVTDPLGDAWIDLASNSEDGDLCIMSFGPAIGGAAPTAYNEVIGGHHYYLQEEWSNDDSSCQPRDEPDRVSLSAPSRAHARAPAEFDGRASDPDGSIRTFNWFFGDHRTSRGRHPEHTYRKPGTYRVVLRVTDSSGNWGFDATQIHVGRPGPEHGRRSR